MIFKSGANGCSPDGLTRWGLWIAIQADIVHRAICERPVVITSTTEGKHSVKRSGHYRGDAVDIRIHYTDKEGRTAEFVARLKRRLGKHFVVILEGNHIHAHWSPVYEEKDGS